MLNPVQNPSKKVEPDTTPQQPSPIALEQEVIKKSTTSKLQSYDNPKLKKTNSQTKDEHLEPKQHQKTFEPLYKFMLLSKVQNKNQPNDNFQDKKSFFNGA